MTLTRFSHASNWQEGVRGTAEQCEPQPTNTDERNLKLGHKSHKSHCSEES